MLAGTMSMSYTLADIPGEKTMEERLQTTTYLQVVHLTEDVAIYHSLFGRLCVVEDRVLKLLDLFKKPCSGQEVLSTSDDYSEEEVINFIDFFKINGYLVEPGFDEYSIVKKDIEKRREDIDIGKQISVLQLVISNNCNFQCDYCFINHIYSSPERFQAQESRENKVMTTDGAKAYIEEIIKLIINAGKKTLSLQFFFFFPLLNWKVIKFVLDNFGDGKKYGIQMNYTIVTNGSLFTEEIVDYFKKYNVPVILSFDSPHSKERVLSNGKGSVKVITQGLELLRDNGNKVVFNSVLCDDNFDYFSNDIVDFALEYGVREIGVLLDLEPAFYKNRNYEDIVGKLYDLYTYGVDKGVAITGYWHAIFQGLVSYDALRERGYKSCSATGCQLSVEPRGDVFACKGSSGFFGNILKPEELLASENYKKYAMRAFRNAPECERCEIENFCSGFCLGPLEKKYNKINVIEPNACIVYKSITKKLIKYHAEKELETLCL